MNPKIQPLREIPQVTLTPCPPAYAMLCAEGWDTVQEAISHKLAHGFDKLLGAAKAAAVDVRDDLSGTVPLQLGPEEFQMHATGAKGGFRYRLSNADYLLMIGSPEREWTISVRYLSAGLWAHGVDELRARVFRALEPYTEQRSLDCVRVSRADWAFDFWSPSLRAEFRPGMYGNIVAHGAVKSTEKMTDVLRCRCCGSNDIERLVSKSKELNEEWQRAGQGETLTTGAKDALQLQLYDKTREITDVSGKEWLYDLWIARLGFDPWAGEKPRDVFRLELRWASDYLKERNLRRPFEVTAALAPLIIESVVKRRLTVPTGDSNRSRWPLHPIWSEAMRIAGARYMVPIGRRVTGARAALVSRARSQIAGAIRSAVVLKNETFDMQMVDDLWTEVLSVLSADPEHEKKVDAALDRYSTVDAAR